MSGTVSNGYHGYIDPNFPNPKAPGDASIIIYGYTPSLTLGIIGVLLFAVHFIVHLVLLLKAKKRPLYFSIPILVGTGFEIVGYVMRILSNRISPYRINFFVIQYFFIVVAPVFFSAAIYGVLSSLLLRLGPRYSPIFGPRTILAVFITTDVVTTVIQVAGAALIGVAESNRKDATTPNNILLAGLSIQVFSFFVFLVLLFTFVFKARDWLAGRNVEVEYEDDEPKTRGGPSRSVMMGIFVLAGLLIYLRTTYRLSETAEGLFSTLQTHEAYFGALEFAPVVVAVGLLAVAHPSRWVSSN